MAIQVVHKVHAIQYNGTNGAEIQTELNALYTLLSSNYSVTVTNTTGSGFRINSYYDGIFSSYEDRSINDWVVLERPTNAASILTSSEFNAKYSLASEVMTLLTPSLPTAIASSRTVDNAVTRSIVTGTGATGFQISSTRATEVNYKVNTSTTATIGGASTSTVVLEICPTNSATAGDWKEVGRVSNSQTITLAVALQSVQVLGGSLVGYVPAGYYAKLRSITSGTASTTYLTGQEVML